MVCIRRVTDFFGQNFKNARKVHSVPNTQYQKVIFYVNMPEEAAKLVIKISKHVAGKMDFMSVTMVQNFGERLF